VIGVQPRLRNRLTKRLACHSDARPAAVLGKKFVSCEKILVGISIRETLLEPMR
jgi:hypothetical protein